MRYLEAAEIACKERVQPRQRAAGLSSENEGGGSFLSCSMTRWSFSTDQSDDSIDALLRFHGSTSSLRPAPH